MNQITGAGLSIHSKVGQATTVTMYLPIEY
ncbi:hypothetical protein M2105_000460 [Paenibacillus sp. PastF-1]|nr:hypothetical protein [Paenibacillus sp. PastF-2]MDF9846045.1 hypothetical protein [Paenibacillus sp. PastM-2]MDF9852618.1 hypothetical protein [Paenibacillus sp. PastF-1]MDH6477651.1 hypothetical protein [Paenibacillus sp. PastH-2]